MKTVSALLFAGVLGTSLAASAQMFPEGRFPSYIDEKTQARVYNLTPGDAQDQIVYQTHPMWTPGMELLLFRSDRSGAGLRPHVVVMATGEIKPVPLPDGAGDLTLSPVSGRAYFLKDRTLWHISIPEALTGGAAAESLSELPEPVAGSQGGMSVGATGEAVYLGVTLKESEELRAIFRFDVATKTWRELGRVAFKIGHVQAAPVKDGGVSFCQESGGDTAQRTWFVDEKGGAPQPFFVETQDEWVTHEVWWGEGRLLFTVWPYDEKTKAQPHGILMSRLGEKRAELIAQYPAWHTHGSPDGKWVLGDDHDRSLWLVDMATRERRLLTQGHQQDPWKTHPHASFTPDSKAVLMNSSRFGNEDLLLVEIPGDFSSLPKP